MQGKHPSSSDLEISRLRSSLNDSIEREQDLQVTFRLLLLSE